MPLDPAVVAEAKSWLAKAAGDLAAGAHDLRAEPPLVEDVVFHAQQAVEKALKGFLTWHGRVFRKTYNLVELGGAVSVIAPPLEGLLRQAAPLTEYAWKFRYPGHAESPSPDEARQALAVAEKVFQRVRAEIPTEVWPDACP
jgi:HEPN domain-containing protein